MCKFFVIALLFALTAAETICRIPGSGDVGSAIESCCNKPRPLRVLLTDNANTKPIVLDNPACDNMIVDLGGHTLSAPTSIGSWGSSPKAFFLINGLDKVTVTNGIIDGNGETWWKRDSTGHCINDPPRPLLAMNYHTNGVTWSNLLLKDSPKFHLQPNSAQNTVIHNITIRAPFTKSSCELDGIDPSNSNGVFISKCDIHSGDDNVAIKPGCNNIVVEDCTFRSGHGASIGSVPKGTITNVVFRRIKFVPSPDGKITNGARIKTWPNGVGLVHNVTFEGFDLDGVQYPIVVDTSYSDGAKSGPSSSGNYYDTLKTLSSKWLDAKTLDSIVANVKKTITYTPNGIILNNINYKNFVIKNTPDSYPPSIVCSTGSPCINFFMENIQGDDAITCKNVFGRNGRNPISPISFSQCLKQSSARAVAGPDHVKSADAPVQMNAGSVGVIVVVIVIVLLVAAFFILRFVKSKNKQVETA